MVFCYNCIKKLGKWQYFLTKKEVDIMTTLVERIALTDKVSNGLAVDNGYVDWVDCRSNDYDLSEEILKQSSKIVKKYMKEVAS